MKGAIMDKAWYMALATNGNVVFLLIAVAVATPTFIVRRVIRRFNPDKD